MANSTYGMSVGAWSASALTSFPLHASPGAVSGVGGGKFSSFCNIGRNSIPYAMWSRIPGIGIGMNGKYKLVGTVVSAGVPYKNARITVFPMDSRTMCVADAQSAADGTFAIYGLSNVYKYLVLATDPAAVYNVKGFSHIVPVVM